MASSSSDELDSESERLSTEKIAYEIWMEIFSYLDQPDLRQLHMTDSYLSGIVRMPLIKKSKLLVSPTTYEGLKQSVLSSDEILPFYIIEVDGVPFDEDLKQILTKCVTPRLHRLIVSNVDEFKWTFVRPFEEFETVLEKLEHMDRV